MSTNVTSSTLISKDLVKFRGKREKNLVSENTCLAKTHDGTIHVHFYLFIYFILFFSGVDAQTVVLYFTNISKLNNSLYYFILISIYVYTIFFFPFICLHITLGEALCFTWFYFDFLKAHFSYYPFTIVNFPP